MHGSYQTFQPVVGEPLPHSVRAAIHSIMREGLTFISASEVGGRWQIRYRDGSRHKCSFVPSEALANLGGDAA